MSGIREFEAVYHVIMYYVFNISWVVYVSNCHLWGSRLASVPDIFTNSIVPDAVAKNSRRAAAGYLQ